jgi:hypothetical protein
MLKAMRIILIIAVVLAVIAAILAATSSVLLGLGAVSWFIFSWLAYLVDLLVGERFVTTAAPVRR